jgi:hypothetical protein
MGLYGIKIDFAWEKKGYNRFTIYFAQNEKIPENGCIMGKINIRRGMSFQ